MFTPIDVERGRSPTFQATGIFGDASGFMPVKTVRDFVSFLYLQDFGMNPKLFDHVYYKYCHNSVNIRDIRDISAYLSTTDITVYHGIYSI